MTQHHFSIRYEAAVKNDGKYDQVVILKLQQGEELDFILKSVTIFVMLYCPQGLKLQFHLGRTVCFYLIYWTLRNDNSIVPHHR